MEWRRASVKHDVLLAVITPNRVESPNDGWHNRDRATHGSGMIAQLTARCLGGCQALNSPPPRSPSFAEVDPRFKALPLPGLDRGGSRLLTRSPDTDIPRCRVIIVGHGTATLRVRLRQTPQVNEIDAVESRGLLDSLRNADIMSDMKTFTVRDLDRSPSTVLEASKADGRARIRARGGQTYLVIPETAPEKAMTGLPDFKRRRQRLSTGVLSAATTEQLDKAIGGE